jgi:rhodanese-related sulfurtransferase
MTGFRMTKQQHSDEITPVMLKTLIETGQQLTILDVRQRWETEICAIANSFNIPLDILGKSLNTLPMETPIVVICHHGIRSLQAALLLKAQGFSLVKSLKGGIDAWAKQIETTLKLY